MFISNNWLHELTGTKLDPPEIRDRLTNVGLAVDAVEARADDFVLDVEVPSNRGDCLSHVGIARELSVIDRSKVQSPKFKVPNTKNKTTDFATVEIRDPDLCPRYAARIARGLKIAPSPEWLVKKLEAIGQRPINNVADITNYVLHELGQPLHAFDLAKLAENRIVVRRARQGETIKTLDGVDRKLDREMLVIADANKAVAVAGVMGGEASQIHQDTFSTKPLLAFAYLVLVGSLIGFTAYAWLIRNVRTSVVSTYAYVNPVVAVALGAIFLNEAIGATTLLAGVAIVLAVVLIVRGRSAPAPAPAAEIRAAAPGATLAA